MLIWRSLSPVVLARVMELLMTRRAAGVVREDRPPAPLRDEPAGVLPPKA
jgi:hypothetical protein